MMLKEILKEYSFSFLFTLGLIFLEAWITILFPLFIGYAIEDALEGGYYGVLQLGLIGIAAMIVGAGRRLFDSRFYAQVYQSIGTMSLSKMKDKCSSKKAARLGMIGELVEFLENSFPALISNVIGLLGAMIILFSLSLKVFLGALMVSCLIFLIYWISSAKTIRLNKLYNDEFEKQVDVIQKNDEFGLKLHLKEMMKWNIKLSDLEAANFSISWIVLMVFLVLAIVVAVGDGLIKYGALFSLLMYVFQYIEQVLNLPLFYQNYLRLQEIKERLEEL